MRKLLLSFVLPAAIVATAAGAAQPTGATIGNVLPPERAAAVAADAKASDTKAGVAKVSAIVPQGNTGSTGVSTTKTTKTAKRERSTTGR